MKADFVANRTSPPYRIGGSSSWTKPSVHMPTKLQTFSQLSEATAKQITAGYTDWKAFLKTAARLYKCFTAYTAKLSS